MSWILRGLVGVFCLVVLHDVIRWNYSLLYRSGTYWPGGWIRSQSQTAQITWRAAMGIIAAFILMAVVFGR